MTEQKTPTAAELLSLIEGRAEDYHQKAVESAEIARKALSQLREWIDHYKEQSALFDTYLDQVIGAKSLVEVMSLSITVCEKRKALSKSISKEEQP